jgi:hypothetical protein
MCVAMLLLQTILDRVYDFYSNYKQAEGKPAVQFYPLDAASPAEHWLGVDFTVDQVLIPRQEDHALLLAGGCQTEACEEMWWAGKPEVAEEEEEAAAEESAGR